MSDIKMNRLNKIVGHIQKCSTMNDDSIESKECNNNSFEYTMSDAMLTTEQRQFYEENGYVVIKRLLNDSEVSKYYNRFDELVANPKDGPSTMIVMRDVSLKGLSKKDRKSERVVTKLQNWAYDRILWQFATNKRIISYIESIIGYDIRAHHFMEINKPSDPGALSSRHPLHQDQWYFPFAPSKYIVCAWTALQPINRQNGCLVVIPGTHKPNNNNNNNNINIGGKLLVHSYPKPWNGPVNKAYHGIQVENEMDMNRLLSKRVHLEMDPGDTVFFHPLLIHGSGANLTDRNRRSISVHYCNSKKVKFIKGGVIPEQKIIAKEVEDLSKKMYNSKVGMPFDLVWKYKSRQVQGDIANFKI